MAPKPSPAQEKPKSDVTPLRQKVACYEVFNVTKKDLKKTRQKILDQAAGHFLGPMPVEEFFKTSTNSCLGTTTFLTRTNSLLRQRDASNKLLAYQVPPNPRSIHNSYVLLNFMYSINPNKCQVDAFTGWSGLWDPKGTPNSHLLRFTDSHKHRDKGCRSYSVDISIYAETLIPRMPRPVMDFANVHCWVEIKPTSKCDAFDDGGEDESVDEEEEYGEDDDIHIKGEGEDAAFDDQTTPQVDVVDNSLREYEDEQPDTKEDIRCSVDFPFEKSSKSASNTRAQLACYAAAAMATQYRQHFFSVLIAGDRVRFIRWDRGAAVVTKAFNITRRPRLLFEFFKRFRQLSLEQRECHPNVRPALKEEAAVARELMHTIAPELWLGVAGEMFLKDIDINTQPFLKIEFDDKTFIVPAPHLHERGLSPFGKATRSSAAVLLGHASDKPKLCYFKDAWRDTRRACEVEIYNHLMENKVSHIATMLCGGDLRYKADGHRFRSRSWVRKPGREPFLQSQRLTHFFIVLDEVGRSLVAFRKAHQLVGGLADAMQAYEDALKKAKVMHCGISANNILLVRDKTERKEWRGILIDWDHAVFLSPVTESDGTSSGRIGTWPFMSMKLLKDPYAPHTELDDRESAVYVLLWIALRHLKIGSSPGLSLSRMIKTFDQHQWDDESGAFVGGSDKFILLFTLAEEPIEFPKISLDPSSNAQVESPMTNLVKTLATPFSLLYQKNELIKSMFADLLQKTVENPDWLISQLRQASDSLKKDTNSDPDWVNNVRDRLSSVEVDQPEWHQSKFYIGYTMAERRNKRPLVYPECGPEDKELREKRSKCIYCRPPNSIYIYSYAARSGIARDVPQLEVLVQ